MWRNKFLDLDPKDRPQTAAEAIKACDADYFPNIFTLLQIACT